MPRISCYTIKIAVCLFMLRNSEETFVKNSIQRLISETHFKSAVLKVKPLVCYKIWYVHFRQLFQRFN